MSLVLCRDLLVTLALGQALSLLICAISLTSKYLANDFHANTPVFQSFLNYILLFLVYTTTLAVRQGTDGHSVYVCVCAQSYTIMLKLVGLGQHFWPCLASFIDFSITSLTSRANPRGEPSQE